MVVLAVVAIIAGFLLPALAGARHRARSAQCQSHLRQWALALSLYANENEGSIPRRGQGVQPLFIVDRPEDWFNALPPLLQLPTYGRLVSEDRVPGPGAKTVFVCPSARRTSYSNFLSYAMNIYLSPTIRPMPHRLDEISDPTTLSFLADGPGDYSSTVPSAKPYSVQARHRSLANVAFLDGHAQAFEGAYLGCGVGDPLRADVRWQTGTSGPNQTPVP